MSVPGRSFPRTGEVKPSYWGSRTPVLGRTNSPTGRRIRSTGLKIPLHGSQKSPWWVSQFRSTGLKNPLHGSQKSAPWVSKFCSMGLKILLHGSQNSAPWVSKIPCAWEAESCLRLELLARRLYVVVHWLPPLLVFPIRPHEPMCRVLFHILRVSGYE